MKNIHLLPTDKPSRIGYYTDPRDTQLYILSNSNKIGDYKPNWKPQNISITNDEEIKEGFRGWFIGQCGFPKKCVDTKIINNELYLLDYLGNTDRLIWCKKVILTTDQDLDGVQAIDDEFLEWFVIKSNDSEKPINIVEVINNWLYYPKKWEYKIIIPKEEQDYTALLKQVGTIQETTLENKLKSLVKEWQERQCKYQDIAQTSKDEHTDRKFTYKAMATRDCWKELLKLIEDEK